MLFVTFHGGSSTDSINNIYAYITGSGPQKTASSTSVLNLLYPDQLSELRAMVLANGCLYVANGSKHTSNILCFHGSGTIYDLVSTLVCGNVDSVNHPFSLVFDGAGHCFVSNQDTNVVAIFNVGASGETTTPGPVASYLTGLGVTGTFLDATFVASKVGNLPNVPPAPTLEKGQGGLDVTVTGEGKDEKVQHSVRDLAFANGILFVVDEPGDCVRMYDPSTGEYHGKSSGDLKSPTHLLIQGATMYVTAGSEIWTSPLPTDPSNPTLNFTSVFSTTLGDVAGLAFDQATPPNSYVAIRTSTPPQILICDSQLQNPAQFTTCADSPEFLLYVPD
ncbi:MAG TPA: hypothetical protein VIX89_10125 [Bryobacteraceae bacterium]